MNDEIERITPENSGQVNPPEPEDITDEFKTDGPPLAECRKCERKSWVSEVGNICGVPQPDGSTCDGIMAIPSKKIDAPDDKAFFIGEYDKTRDGYPILDNLDPRHPEVEFADTKHEAIKLELVANRASGITGRFVRQQTLVGVRESLMRNIEQIREQSPEVAVFIEAFADSIDKAMGVITVQKN